MHLHQGDSPTVSDAALPSLWHLRPHPDLLLLDEPSGGFDDARAAALCDLLCDPELLGSSAVLIATHDPRLSALSRPGCAAASTRAPPRGDRDEHGGSRATVALHITPASSSGTCGRERGATPLARTWGDGSSVQQIHSRASASPSSGLRSPSRAQRRRWRRRRSPSQCSWWHGSSGVQILATLRLALALTPALVGIVLANLFGGASVEEAIGAGTRLLAFAAGSLVLLRPFEPLRMADAFIERLRAPFASNDGVARDSCANSNPARRGTRERRAIRRLTRARRRPATTCRHV